MIDAIALQVHQFAAGRLRPDLEAFNLSAGLRRYVEFA
jgi:hypothetical protein